MWYELIYIFNFNLKSDYFTLIESFRASPILPVTLESYIIGTIIDDTLIKAPPKGETPIIFASPTRLAFSLYSINGLPKISFDDIDYTEQVDYIIPNPPTDKDIKEALTMFSVKDL